MRELRRTEARIVVCVGCFDERCGNSGGPAHVTTFLSVTAGVPIVTSVSRRGNRRGERPLRQSCTAAGRRGRVGGGGRHGYDDRMADVASLDEQLKEIGAQLDWVRDYL
jgi:hypothetical protein